MKLTIKLSLLIVFLFQAVVWASDVQPICRLGIISTPYITAASKEELGERSWLLDRGQRGFNNAINALNDLKPDCFIALGPLTWTGSDQDFELLKTYLTQIKIPAYLSPYSQDISDGGGRFLKQFGEKFGGKLRYSLNIKGVHLIFNSLPLEKPDAQNDFLQWLEKELNNVKDSKAVIFIGNIYPLLDNRGATKSEGEKRIFELIEKHHISAIVSGAHAHMSNLHSGLYFWSAPTSAWEQAHHLGLISIYEERIEFSLYKPGNPMQVLTVPNPVKAKRHDAENDSYGLPAYTEDLARKPELSFVLLGDPQLDDMTVERYRSGFSAAESMSTGVVAEINRLKPPLVLVAGDLTNKNTPTEWALFNKIYKQLNMPVYLVPGNHDNLIDKDMLTEAKLGDLLDSAKSNWVFHDTLKEKGFSGELALYQYFTREFASNGKPYYSVEKNGVAFIALDTSANDEPDGGIGTEQMEWFTKELDRAKNAKHVFVLTHYPVDESFRGFGLKDFKPEREKVISLLKEHKVSGFLFGHRHACGFRLIDNVPHVLADDMCWGEYSSYWIVHVFPEEIVFCWKPFVAPRMGPRSVYERIIFHEPRMVK